MRRLIFSMVIHEIKVDRVLSLDVTEVQRINAQVAEISADEDRLLM